MSRIIAWALFLFAGTAWSQQQTNLVAVSSAWEIIDSTRIGAKTRVEAFNQNPYPFCFSYAASALFDQTRCHHDKLEDCRQQPRSSALAATPAGQRIPQNQLKTENGGVTALSLSDIVNRGFVPHGMCNTNFGQETNQDLNQRMTSGRSTVYDVYLSWKKYRDWTPYLTRFYRHYFLEHAGNMNPRLTRTEVESLLADYSSQEQLMGAILIGEQCSTKRILDDRFEIKQAFVGEAERFDPKQAYKIIKQNLEKNRPVSVDFCLFNVGDEYGRCSSNARHAAVIVAQAQARNRATGDTRTVYWLVNTWGEQWQEKNRDGWIFADNLLLGVYGHILWLENR